MKKSGSLVFTLTYLLFAISNLSVAQKIESIELSQKLSILNKRAFLKFPAKAANIARGNLMSADPSQDRETRIIMDIGKMRFVFLSRELYKFTDGDFLTEVKNTLGERVNNIKVIAHKKGLLSIASTPMIFDSTQNAILVNSLLVKTQDNSIFRIDAFISPSAFKHKHEFSMLARRIFMSLQIGSRVNERKARNENVNIRGTKKNFYLFVPPNYSVTVDKRYDFQVIEFHKYTKFTDTSWLSLMIYTGNFPWKDYERYGFDVDSSKNVIGTFVNQQLSWMTFQDNKRNVFVKEQEIPFDKVEDGLIVHIGMLSDKRESIAELTDIVEAIKIDN